MISIDRVSTRLNGLVVVAVGSLCILKQAVSDAKSQEKNSRLNIDKLRKLRMRMSNRKYVLE